MNNKGSIIVELLSVVIFVGIIVVIVYFGFQIEYGNEREVTCTVNEKWTKRGSGKNSKDVYLVSCGNEVYKIEDLLWKGKFDSSNIYANLKVGKKYKLTVTGYRFGYFSSYQNINEYELDKDK